MYKVKNRIFLDDKELKQLTELCRDNVTQKQISDIMCISIDTIRRICKENNIKTSTIRKKSVNEDYFNLIDSHEKAYWLGFIYADGCVYSNKSNGNYIVTITLTESDKDVIKQFKKDIKSDHKISRIKPSIFNGHVSKPKVGISISSKKIYKSLIKLGLSECKSLRLKKPNIQSKYYPSFIRGYFDGDGSVYCTKSRNNTFYRCSITGSTEFMKWIRSILPIDVRLYKEKRTNGIYYICIQTKNSFTKFYKYLYSTPGYKMERKYNKYSEFIHKLNGAPETEMVLPLEKGNDTVHSLDKSKALAN